MRAQSPSPESSSRKLVLREVSVLLSNDIARQRRETYSAVSFGIEASPKSGRDQHGSHLSKRGTDSESSKNRDYEAVNH